MTDLSAHIIMLTLGWLPIAMIGICTIALMFNPRDARWGNILLIETATFLFMMAMGWLHQYFKPSSSTNYDQYLYVLDHSLFGAPSFYLGRFLNAHLYFKTPIECVYGTMLIPVRILILIYFLDISIPEGYRLVRTFVYNDLFAVPCYLLIPATGPKYAFSCFPLLPSDVHPHIMTSAAFANAMPSIHFSTALLVAAFLWRWKTGRVIGVVWVTLTAIATLGLGEHYVLDLIAAVPYTGLMMFMGGYRYRVPIRWRKTVVAEAT